MKVVRKYVLDVAQKQTIAMPMGCQKLCIRLQNGMPTLWVLVDEEAPLTDYVFCILFTGETTPLDDFWTYIDTCQLDNGIVLHVFYV